MKTKIITTTMAGKQIEKMTLKYNEFGLETARELILSGNISNSVRTLYDDDNRIKSIIDISSYSKDENDFSSKVTDFNYNGNMIEVSHTGGDDENYVQTDTILRNKRVLVGLDMKSICIMDFVDDNVYIKKSIKNFGRREEVEYKIFVNDIFMQYINVIDNVINKLRDYTYDDKKVLIHTKLYTFMSNEGLSGYHKVVEIKYNNGLKDEETHYSSFDADSNETRDVRFIKYGYNENQKLASIVEMNSLGMNIEEYDYYEGGELAEIRYSENGVRTATKKYEYQ